MATSGVHDSTLIFPTLRKFRVYRNGKILKPEILSLDKAYTGKIIKRGLRKMNVRYRIPNKTDAKQPESIPKLKPFRWTVERTIAWINAFRALKTKWEVKIENYSALFKLACAFILWRMTKW
ncbi:transposase, IS4 family [Leptospira wolffii serovar Khorat str. Khorat-H2]|nr:transposase, IS4 family [Leptospira wolffii serovar Khorat str. Khorat-H2]